MHQEVVGLIPAGGQGKRIAPLPCSKELYPIGFRTADEEHGKRPKVVCHYLLEKMRLAEIRKVYVVLREGKWDIPAYLQDGNMVGMHIAYLMVSVPFGAPYTLDQAYPFVRDAVVTFGFPDILFEPDDAFVRLLAHQDATKADLLLGLFPCDQPGRVDVVDVDSSGRVQQVLLPPSQGHLLYTWGIAVWAPSFTQFLHEYVAARRPSAAKKPELSVGHVIQAAIRQGLRTEALHLSSTPYMDIGTPENLARAVKRFAPT